MKKLCCSKNAISIVLTSIICFSAFQNLLESVWGPFSYIDELVALLGILLWAYDVMIVKKFNIARENMWFLMALCVFVITGLTGNLIFRYQPMKSVVIDLYTNLKFFFAMAAGYYLFQNADETILQKISVLNARVIILILFGVFLLDCALNIYPGEIRYGMKSAQLFFAHPTYLAADCAFLIVLLTIFYQKKSIFFIAIALFLMTFTLRSKSIVSAMAYVAMFAFFIIMKQKVKWWQILVLVVAGILVAWPKIHYYYIELDGTSARSIMMWTSLDIMKENFPIGTGFATFGSAEAAKCYSPVYLQYGFNDHFELRDINNLENTLRLINKYPWMQEIYQQDPSWAYYPPFLTDSFWPILFGQTGFLGTIAYIYMLAHPMLYCLKSKTINVYRYVGILFVFVYLLISTFAETSFHNALAIPLAFTVGLTFSLGNKESRFRGEKDR